MQLFNICMINLKEMYVEQNLCFTVDITSKKYNAYIVQLNSEMK